LIPEGREVLGHLEPVAAEQLAQHGHREVRAVLIAEVPERGMLENPLEPGRLEEDADVGAVADRAADGPQELARPREVLDDVAGADQVTHERRRLRLVASRDDRDAGSDPIPLGNVARIEAETTAAGGRAQPGQEFPLAAADLDDRLPREVVASGEPGRERVEVAAEVRRVRLGVLVRRSVSHESFVEGGVEHEAAVRAEAEVDVAPRAGEGLRQTVREDVLMNGDLGDVQDLCDVEAPARRTRQ